MANGVPNLFGETADKNETKRRMNALRSFLIAFNAGLSDERVFVYMRGLQDLTPAQFNRALDESLRKHNSSFPPSPGEMHDYLAAAIEKDGPAKSRANALCPECEGLGWVVKGEGPDRQAVRCECVTKTKCA